MNHIYRLIFNHTLGVMQAAPETAKGRGKHNASGSRMAAVGTFLILTLAPGPALADGGSGGGAYGDVSVGRGGAGGTMESPGGKDGTTGASTSQLEAGGAGGGGGGPGGGAGGLGAPGQDPILGLGRAGSGGNGGSGGEHGYYHSELPVRDASGSNGGDGESGDASYYVGGGGGGGGAGGYGAVVINDESADATLNLSLNGGIGGRGGSGGGTTLIDLEVVPATHGGDGGAGGDGGIGLLFVGRTLTTAGEIAAGAGGAGGNGGLSRAKDGNATADQGGDGGDGGAGLSFTGDMLTNTGGISGGMGGVGGAGNAGGYVDIGNGGDGGQGGTGVLFNDGTLINTGTISGGTGGLRGFGGRGGVDGLNGEGGEGIIGSNLVVINAGTVKGGLSGEYATQANAITFTGGTNRLELQRGYTIRGHVVANGNHDTLVLGGDETPNNPFLLKAIGEGKVYQGFEAFEKNGESSWALMGPGRQDWTINAGVLSSVEDGAFGNRRAFVVNGGTLRLNNRDLIVSSLSGRGGTVDIGSARLEVAPDGDISYAGAIVGSGHLVKTGSGTLTLLGANTYSGGTAVNEGTLQIGNGTESGQLPSGYTTLSTNATLRVYRTGELVHAGTINGDGHLEIAGYGTLTLIGNSNRTGHSTVYGGTLNIGDNDHADAVLRGPVTVESSGTLGGTGRVADTTTIANGATLAPGYSGIGGLTIEGDLSLAQGALLDFELGKPGDDFTTPGQSDTVTVTGNLALNGAMLNLTQTGDFGAGLYRLFDYAGKLTQENGGILLGDDTNAMRLQYRDHQINLLNTTGATLNVWAGDDGKGGDGTWSKTSASWTDADGQVVAPMQPQPGFAIFQDQGGMITLDDVDGAIQATGLQFAQQGYVLQGDALELFGQDDGYAEVRVGDGSENSGFYTATIGSVIAGSDGLNKTGAGALILGGENTYTGRTTLTDGLLIVSKDANLGNRANPLTIRGGTLLVTGAGFESSRNILIDAPSGVFDISADATLKGTIQGDGDLIKTGAGELRLLGKNGYVNTIVSTGSLVGNTTSIKGNLINNGTVTFEQDIDGTFTGDISTLNTTNGINTIKDGAGTLTLTGRSSVNWIIREGSLTVAADRLTGNVLIGSPMTSLTLINDGDIAYNGSLSGNGQVSINSTGTTSLGGDSSGFLGHTTLNQGTLSVGEADGSGILGGSLAIANGTTLTGSGTVGSLGDSMVMIASGATLAPGHDGIGTLTVAGDLTMDQGSILDFDFGTPSVDLATPGQSDSVTVKGDLVLHGATLNLPDAPDFGAGLYRLFDYNGTLTQNNGGIALVTDRQTLRLQYRAHEINLVNTDGMTLNAWRGANGDGGDGVWSNQTAHWSDVDGHITMPMVPQPGFAVFQDSGGTITLDNADGAVQATGIQFAGDGYLLRGDALTLIGESDVPPEIRVGDGSNDSHTYIAQIDSIISGSHGLHKTGAGKLVLGGENTYSGNTTLSGGVLSVSNNANLGDEGGTLTFNGGSLATTANMDMDRAVLLQQTGRFDVAANTDLDLTGIVSGSGDLIKDGAGTLHLTHTGNAYGNTHVRSGTLIGNGASISGNLTNDGTVIFDQSTDGTYAGNISGHGTLRKDGEGTLTLIGTSASDWHLDQGELLTDARGFTGNAAIGADGTLIFHQTQDATYAGTLTGTGRFNKTGENTLVYNGNSATFTGTTDVHGGTLIVGAAASHHAAVLGGSFIVANGATLGGHGIVGSGMVPDTGTNTNADSFSNSGVRSQITIASGGTLSPGNSIGTLTVDGDLTFESGSRFEIEVDPQQGTSDRVDVKGVATLQGGAVAHIGVNGNYDLHSRYTILSAEQVKGTFDSVTSDFAFLTPDLTYSQDTVDLTLSRNDVGFAAKAETVNQRTTARAIDSIGLAADHAVYNAIAQLPDNIGLIGRSLDALSGEIHASLKSALIEDSRFIRNAANDRLRAAFGSARNTAMTYAPGTAPDTLSNVVWSQAFGSWGKLDGNDAALDHDTAGMLIGSDTQVGNWRLGALAGYSRSTFDTDDRDSSGSSDNYHLGIYGGTHSGNLHIRTGAAYSWHRIDTHRSVSMPGLHDSLKSRYDANTFQMFGELGYDVRLGPTRLEPFANLAYVNLHTDHFSEHGGAAALSGKSDSTETAFTTLGLRAEHDLILGSVDTSLRGTLGWRYGFGDITPDSTHRFSVGNAFTITGVPIAKNAAVIEAGIDIHVAANTRIGLSYAGQLAGSAQDHGVKAEATIRF